MIRIQYQYIWESDWKKFKLNNKMGDIYTYEG